MSNAVLPRPRLTGLTKRSFVLVAARFNAEYVQGLVNHATEEIRALSPMSSMSLHQVPGAFEIPIVVREIAARKTADAIIAFGVILQGKTSHAENLSRSVTDALQQIALEHGVPVIHAVLCMETKEEARARCLESKINRGVEAARAAVEMAGVMSELRAK